MESKEKKNNSAPKPLLSLLIVLFILLAVYAVIDKTTSNNPLDKITKSSSFSNKSAKKDHSYKVVAEWLGRSPTPIIHYNLPDGNGSGSMLNTLIWKKVGNFSNKASFEINCQHNAVFLRLYIDNELVKEVSPSSNIVSLSYQYKANN